MANQLSSTVEPTPKAQMRTSVARCERRSSSRGPDSMATPSRPAGHNDADGRAVSVTSTRTPGARPGGTFVSLVLDAP